MSKESGNDNVKVLPVTFKKPRLDGPTLTVADGLSSCNHRWFFLDGGKIDIGYILRPGETQVECDNCHAKLDPIWVLRQLALEGSKWQHDCLRFQEEMARLSERSKTKCVHCGKMTPISRG